MMRKAMAATLTILRWPEESMATAINKEGAQKGHIGKEKPGV